MSHVRQQPLLACDRLGFFQKFDAISVYYDDGQWAVSAALHDAHDCGPTRAALSLRPAGNACGRLAPGDGLQHLGCDAPADSRAGVWRRRAAEGGLPRRRPGRMNLNLPRFR